MENNTKWWTLGAMCFALFMVMLDNTVVNIALPAIKHSFGASISGLSWTVNAYTLVFGVLLVSGGRLGDVFGRKRMFLAGLIVLLVGGNRRAMTREDVHSTPGGQERIRTRVLERGLLFRALQHVELDENVSPVDAVDGEGHFLELKDRNVFLYMCAECDREISYEDFWRDVAVGSLAE